VGVYAPLRDAALRLGLRYRRYAEARQMVLDRQGAVVGVRILQIPEGSASAGRFARHFAAAAKWISALPPSFPLAGIVYGVGRWYLKRAQAIEARHRVSHVIRARRGVVLSAGGFIMNQPMIEHYSPRHAPGLPNGTLGDDGSGILLGASAGGALGRMDRISSWRFINPPAAWAQGMLVNREGRRFVNEILYGASIGDAIVDQTGGKAWVILDAGLRRLAGRQAGDVHLVPFQRDVARLNHLFNCVKAPTIAALADRIGVDRDNLQRALDDYNAAARGERSDPFGKARDEMTVLGGGPYYAIDASVDSRLLPLSTMSLGGLRIDEESGQVLGESGAPIAGLYAAGRNAIGVCSNVYVSGLSYADCIFSGRRVARHLAPVSSTGSNAGGSGEG